MSRYQWEEDSYSYPGTSILRNREGIMDPAELAKAEAISVHQGLMTLALSPLSPRFDTSHLQQIHCILFNELYDWAGTFRTVNIYGSDQASYCRPEFIHNRVDDILANLGREKHLTNLSTAQFIQRTAYFLGELNAIHPFRDGNGRTLRQFFAEVAINAGRALSWTVSREEMIAASKLAFRHFDHSGLCAVIEKSLVPTVLERTHQELANHIAKRLEAGDDPILLYNALVRWKDLSSETLRSLFVEQFHRHTALVALPSAELDRVLEHVERTSADPVPRRTPSKDSFEQER